MTQIRVLISVLFFAFSLPAFSAQVTGVIDGVYGSTIKGWACVTTRTASIPIHIYAGGQAHVGTRVAVDTASDASEVAVDNACQHPGARARHRFSYTFSEAQKRQFQGKKIYVHGIGDGVTNLLLNRSGVFVMPAPSQTLGLGVIDGVYNSNTIQGWACIKGQTRSVVVDIYAGSKLIKSVSAYKPSGSTIASQCGHAGINGNHRFYVSLSNYDKTLYAGQTISARVRETSALLANSGKFQVPGEVSYVFNVTTSPYKQLTGDKASLGWDILNTKNCSQIKGTVLSFPGGAGTSHGLSLDDVKRVERVLGAGCVRLIRVDVNPGSNSSTGGYWLRNDSYKSAATLVTNITQQAIQTWKDVSGLAPALGRVIVVGSSAGGMISASALEWSPTYRSIVDRTIMVSGPLGSDISFECGVIKKAWLKDWLDDIFKTGTTCQTCTNPFTCNVSATKDVVDISNSSLRAYLQTSQFALKQHEIAILVGAIDPIGCVDNTTSDCGNWNAAQATRRYIQSVTAGQNIFQQGGVSSRWRPFTQNVISGGTHDLWGNSVARQLICKNALEEVGVSYSICNSL